MIFKQGIHPKVVHERLGHSSIEMTLDIYSHVVSGLQEAAAAGFDEMLYHSRENISMMSDLTPELAHLGLESPQLI